MFIRWTKREVSGFEGNWGLSQRIPGLESHSAALLRTFREGGKVRQERLASLGFFTTQNGALTAQDAGRFLRHAETVLDTLELSGSDRKKVQRQLEAAVLM